MADLSGRELDEAVAKLLGWTVVETDTIDHEPAELWLREGMVLAIEAPPAYSTDFALLPEMLGWLRERLRTGHELALEDDGAAWVAATYVQESYGRDYFQTAKGATLPEAVARLVVAVAAKEAK